MQMFMSTRNRQLTGSLAFKLAIAVWLCLTFTFTSQASDFYYPWRDKEKALVIDAYEKNPIDWQKMVTDKRIRAFIGKASDGLPSPWTCRGNETEIQICKKSFQNYWMKQQLYQTRKLVAKQLGLKWGAYHLGRPGNPIAQANHFLDFAQPDPDDLIALDIEHDDPGKWISFKDAEIFARQVYKRIGRYPVLYTNHHTAQQIALRRDEFPLLSRMQLWYARFKGDVRGSFPMGNWDSYALWQFSAHPNCNKRRCLYRVPGTEPNIDVNVSTLSIEEFEKAWPFDGLVPERSSKPEVLMVENKSSQPAKSETENRQTDQAKGQTRLASIVPTPAPREKTETTVAIAPLVNSASESEPEPQTVEESFQLASITQDNIAIPTPNERKDESSYGITTTDFEPEYEIVITPSDHAEDLTMQLQYISGAL